MNRTSLVECEDRMCSRTGSRSGANGWRRGGREGIGVSWFELPPGKKLSRSISTRHEEAMFVLEGDGVLRLGEESTRCAPATTSPFRRPPAHQVINRSQAPSVSWRSPPCWIRGRRVPDSRRSGCSPPSWMVSVHQQGDAVDYTWTKSDARPRAGDDARRRPMAEDDEDLPPKR